ncbi:serine hydrolase domain-containing protein [Vineibacter terrae]|uniref:serine hydrolase domain-containing protein n=1 Tax=Vineibacter terrae TaxID=2586908 RepID=UPI002E317994|nr:serine hydrolase domain-containing protein [Vineibacter terrae]HEX2887960.1 serine hydrolase domain-containing protein [Vineibacter terrae]
MRYLQRIYAVLVLASFVAVAPAGAEMPLPLADSPEDVGLSASQLARLEAVTREHIDSGLVPGAVMLVVRQGKVAWFKTLGYRDRAANDLMRPDAIFRIYSMTKPIVSVAAMMLVEEGRIQVTDPVARFLPEIGKMKVGVEKADAAGKPTLELVEPENPMTVQDLLRHTSGLIYGARGHSLVNTAYVQARLGDREASTEQFVSRLSALPLRFPPGTRWEYGVSTDVLGRLVEVVSGKTLSAFLAERIFQPLGMSDTAFYVPAGKMARAAQPWQRPDGPPMTRRFDVAQQPRFESGGGGLTSTMEDYLRFALMLSNGGELGEQRLLGRKTIEFMTADHIAGLPGRPPGLGFGLGFEVRRRVGGAGLPGSVGEYGWAGNAGTLFWIDPKEDLIAIYMVQVSDGDRIMLRNQFRTMVQAAIVD